MGGWCIAMEAPRLDLGTRRLDAIGRMQGNASESGRSCNDHQIPRLRRNGLFACIYIQQMLFLLS